MTDTNERKVERGRREQLLTLINGWDPAGVLQAGHSRNEYAPMVERLLPILARKPRLEELTEFLNGEIHKTFHVTPHDTAQFATRALTWYQLSESE